MEDISLIIWIKQLFSSLFSSLVSQCEVMKVVFLQANSCQKVGCFLQVDNTMEGFLILTQQMLFLLLVNMKVVFS